MSNSSARLVFVGVATFDAIALVPNFPSGDERTVADAIEFAGGGPAATAAVAAARLGHPTAYIGAVGDDAEGDRVLGWLDSEGVDTGGVVRPEGRRTGASVVLVHGPTGSRAISTRPVPPLTVPSDSDAADLIRGADWVHVDHIGWKPVDTLLSAVDNDDRPRLSVDAGNAIDDYSPAGVALHVPTVAALEHAYGRRARDELLAAALADGAHTVVATSGADGAVAAARDGTRASAPGYPANVVSTLGAGDVFHGALLSAVVHGLCLDDQLAYANVTAALSCEALDGRSAIPDHDTVLSVVHPDNEPRTSA